MDINNMLNGRSSTAADHRQQQQQQQQQHPASHIGHNMTPMIRNGTGYPSPTEHSQPMTYGYGDPAPYAGLYTHNPEVDGPSGLAQSARTDGIRSYSCQTCNKSFARRSDLGRHERIHSGDRPHVCPEPGCGKPFIQRSALTVHMRVHSGEKPHMCERCGKPFSDSSSLARHRRIHSGKRPYKCPFADCQKTFTRRTTLTRHQNHHTGTVEDSILKTNGLLANRAGSISQQTPQSRRTSDESTASYSDTGSTVSLNSPSERSFTLSPTTDIDPVSHMPPIPRPLNHQQQPVGLGFHSGDSFPLHLHNMRQQGLQQPSPRSSPSASSPTLSAFGSSGNLQRPSHVTSHPGPALPVLEPPAYHDLRSGSGSPHTGSTGSSGWNSPMHPGGLGALPPSPMGSGDYSLYASEAPPPGQGIPLHHPGPLPTYLGSGGRRPSSSEPELYEMKPRLAGIGGGGGWGHGS